MSSAQTTIRRFILFIPSFRVIDFFSNFVCQLAHITRLCPATFPAGLIAARYSVWRLWVA